MTDLFGFSFYSLLGFGFIPQLLCIVHAYRTGRKEWIFPLIIFSFAGVIVYFLFELLPEIQHGDFARNVQLVFFPNRKIKEMERKFRLADTVTNRLNLAEAYAEQKKYDKAIDLAEPCVNDPYINHTGIYIKLARLYFLSGQYKKSLTLFEKAKALNYNRIERPEDELYIARTLDYLGQKQEAEESYKNIIRVQHSMQAMYYYGKMLKEEGRGEEALAMFTKVKEEKELHPRYVRRLNAKWIRLSAIERRSK
ncbi:tetratricopeptide repeat protein [Taibaiella lutea]|uniref:Tetratricopeptide repeat protein n=1 Tax=Taibaiella lutea TaxID=2608001 RepID=A0A5M6CDS6_9BACT|nr:tetratricopeptide repeat protein [Taibaiella lutea]KAA5533251.1 tetratricopeptide repeat protein [Taibaiella lutea]